MDSHKNHNFSCFTFPNTVLNYKILEENFSPDETQRFTQSAHF